MTRIFALGEYCFQQHDPLYCGNSANKKIAFPILDFGAFTFKE